MLLDHDLDFSTTASYNSSLRTHLSVIIVDAIEFESEISKVYREKAMEVRDGFYQTQLKTLERRVLYAFWLKGGGGGGGRCPLGFTKGAF